MTLTIRELSIDDYPAIFALWTETEGVGLSESDSAERLAAFLERNPGLSFVAFDEELLVGAVLCGHDGRRGYIHHLVVRQDQRLKGAGRELVDCCLAQLRSAGILKCHLFVFANNRPAIAFWKQIGWNVRADLKMMSKVV